MKKTPPFFTGLYRLRRAFIVSVFLQPALRASHFKGRCFFSFHLHRHLGTVSFTPLLGLFLSLWHFQPSGQLMGLASHLAGKTQNSLVGCFKSLVAVSFMTNASPCYLARNACYCFKDTKYGVKALCKSKFTLSPSEAIEKMKSCNLRVNI